jgi:predicted nuclease of predicted toxin-antitoxin system
MRFKIDENLHESAAELLRQHGHDAVSVYAQNLRGHDDRDIAAVCRMEQRVLITQDLDFGNILAYPPENYAGIIVLRLRNQSRPVVLTVIGRLLPSLSADVLTGRLWSVEETRVRIHEPGQP